MQTRTAVLIGLLAMAGGWMAGSSSVSHEAQEPRGEGRGPRPLGGGNPPAPFTERLRLKMQEQPRSPTPSRDPFSFGTRRLVPAGSATRESGAPDFAAEPDVAPTLVPRPRFGLSGIASDATPAGPVRTAILSDNGALVFIKAGDALADGYTVGRVDETSVVLVDASGAEQVLRLK